MVPKVQINCVMINSWSDIYISQKYSFKGVIDYDLQSHPGIGTLGLECMMCMHTLRVTSMQNMNVF